MLMGSDFRSLSILATLKVEDDALSTFAAANLRFSSLFASKNFSLFAAADKRFQDKTNSKPLFHRPK